MRGKRSTDEILSLRGASVMGRVQLPGGKKGERQLKKLQKPGHDRELDAMGIPADIFWKLIKRVEKLEKFNKSLESRLTKLDDYWADKMQEQMKRRREGK